MFLPVSRYPCPQCPAHEEKEPKEWTYKDMIGLPAGQLEEWQAACQREIETLTK